jgi:pimeloyl-ACP methyl ester carboxylesterase
MKRSTQLIGENEMNKTRTAAFAILLITGLMINTTLPFLAPTAAASGDWTLIANGRALKAYPDLKEYVWQKNASMAPNGPFDKIGLHRIVKTNTAIKGAVFMIPGIYGNGEKLVSNPSNDSLTKTEETCQLIYWANRGFDVYVIDYRQHFIPVDYNKTQLSFTVDWGMDQVMSDIKDSVEKAKETSGFSKVFLAGMSWGGVLAQIYSAKNWQQDIRGLILLDPAPPKSTLVKNLNQTNSFNLTATANIMKAAGAWVYENPQQSATPSTLNPGYIFLAQFAAQNPGAPAQYLNGTLVTTINPRTNKIFANMTEWFEYGWNTANSYNTYGGYSNITFDIMVAPLADRYWPVKQFLDYNAMLDWTVCPYLSFDYLAHISEINVPVIAFRSGLNLAAYGNITNGMATKDFTWSVLPNYGHGDVFQGTYSARDISEPSYQWMLGHYQPLTASAAPMTASAIPGQSATFSAIPSGGVSPYTYQWYTGPDKLTGQTSAMLTTTETSPFTYTFYCKVTDSEGATANSNSITLAVASVTSSSTTTQTTQKPSPSLSPILSPSPSPSPSASPLPTSLTSPSPTSSNPIVAQFPETTLAIAVAGIVVIVLVIAAIALVIRKKTK